MENKIKISIARQETQRGTPTRFQRVPEHGSAWVNGQTSLLTGVAVFSIFIIVLSLFTVKRGQTWKDDVLLWQDATLKSPFKSRSHNGLGYAYITEGSFDEAIREFEIALKYDNRYNPWCCSTAHFATVHSNLGVAFYKKGLLRMAIEEFKIAIGMDPNMHDFHLNLGMAYGALEMREDAKKEYLKALRLDPGSAKAHNNLGVIYAREGDRIKAIAEFKLALTYNPDYPGAEANLYKALEMRP